MYFMIEVKDPNDIGKNELNRWILHEVESVIDGDYESIGAFGSPVHPATPKQNNKRHIPDISETKSRCG